MSSMRDHGECLSSRPRASGSDTGSCSCPTRPSAELEVVPLLRMIRSPVLWKRFRDGTRGPIRRRTRSTVASIRVPRASTSRPADQSVAVRRPHAACLVARRRPRVAGAVRVDQRHFRAHLAEIHRREAAPQRPPRSRRRQATPPPYGIERASRRDACGQRPRRRWTPRAAPSPRPRRPHGENRDAEAPSDFRRMRVGAG